MDQNSIENAHYMLGYLASLIRRHSNMNKKLTPLAPDETVPHAVCTKHWLLRYIIIARTLPKIHSEDSLKYTSSQLKLVQ